MEKMMLTPRNLGFPEISTLDSKILEVYKEAIGSYKGRALDSLNILKKKGGEVTGSNCFAPLILREVLPEDTRLATMADLGRTTEINPNFFQGVYSDTGLVLRTAADSYNNNDFLAKDLAKQFKRRGIKLDAPKIIYFDALDLKEDKNSFYGLAYELNEKAKLEENIIDAPELVLNFQFKTMNEKGIPIKDEKENRTLYTRKDGLSRFGLNGNSVVDSDYWDLAYSGGGGRVVVVSAEGTRVNSDKYMQNLKQLRDEEIAKINERYEKAKAILSGK